MLEGGGLSGGWRFGGQFGEERVQVERSVRHRHAAVRRAGPFGPIAIAVDLDAVPVRIAEVDGLTDAVVLRDADLYPVVNQSLVHSGEFATTGEQDCEVI